MGSTLYLQFTPANDATSGRWVTFQKCYPPPALRIDDETLAPLRDALSRSSRDTLGFSPLTLKDRIEIEGIVGETDIEMGAVTDFSTHGIYFRLDQEQYVWIHEHESFTGPETWVDPDAATWHETIRIQYQTEEIDTGPINQLMVDYIGHDPRLVAIRDKSPNWYLSNDINDVLPVLAEWSQWRAQQPPSAISLCP